MAMNTWAAIEYGKVDTIGLCHGVQHGGEQIAEVLGAKDKSELEFVCSGINHQTWYVDIRFRGRKIEKDELLAAFERHPVYSKQEKVRIDVLKRFGFYSTEFERPPVRISALVSQAAGRDQPLDRHVALDPRRDRRLPPSLDRNTLTGSKPTIPKILEEAGQPIDPGQRSTEHASYIFEALETGRRYRGHFNVKNRRPDHQPARRTRSSRRPVSSTGSASTWLRE